MATSPYFNNFPKTRTSEQLLFEDLINESIFINGHNVYYVPRESLSSEDLIFGEDPTSAFTKAFPMEMYLNTGNTNEGMFSGQRDTFTKFGTNVADDASLILSRRAFQKNVPANIRLRPREGDLIYIPVWLKLMEIRWVESNRPLFFSLGRTNQDSYMYDIYCESFRFSNEKIDTGVADIDIIETKNSYTITLQLTSGSGNGDFYLGETVYVGSSYALANNVAEVSSWSPSDKVLKVINIKGEILENTVIHGVTSNSYYTITSVNDRGNNSTYDYQDNLQIQSEANSIISLTETNPFGAP